MDEISGAEEIEQKRSLWRFDSGVFGFGHNRHAQGHQWVVGASGAGHGS